MPTVYNIPVEVGQIWESRIARGDGTRERVLILEASGREAKVRSFNPAPKKSAERTIGIGTGKGRVQLANLRLVTLADGTPFNPDSRRGA